MESGESIYGLIPRPIEGSSRESIYRSKHDGKIDPSQFEMGVGSKRGKATFGPPKGTLKPCTNSFMKKHAKDPNLPPPGPVTINKKEKVKPPIPKEPPVMGLRSAKNFITANAVENILAAPKRLPQEPPRAVEKEDYGKVPSYLSSVKDTIRRERDQIASYHQSLHAQNHNENTRRMSDEERQELITGLKLKWQQINEAYQKLPFSLDTPAKKARKEQYEEKLAQIEKDIETLSRRVLLVSEE